MENIPSAQQSSYLHLFSPYFQLRFLSVSILTMSGGGSSQKIASIVVCTSNMIWFDKSNLWQFLRSIAKSIAVWVVSCNNMSSWDNWEAFEGMSDWNPALGASLSHRWESSFKSQSWDENLRLINYRLGRNVCHSSLVWKFRNMWLIQPIKPQVAWNVHCKKLL